MYTRKSLQTARADRIQADTRLLAERMVRDLIHEAALEGKTRFVITPNMVQGVIVCYAHRPLVVPTLLQLRDPIAALLPDVDVYAITQFTDPKIPVDTITVDWS